MRTFKFSEGVLKRKRVPLTRASLKGDTYYASSCPLVTNNNIVGELQTESHVHELVINGVKKFQVNTEAMFNLDPLVVTARFVRTSDALDLTLPVTPSVLGSNQPNHKPRMKITVANGPNRLVVVDEDLPAPTDLKVVKHIQLDPNIQTFFSFKGPYYPDNPPRSYRVAVHGANSNYSEDIWTILDPGETYYFRTRATHYYQAGASRPQRMLRPNTEYSAQVQAEFWDGATSNTVSINFTTPLSVTYDPSPPVPTNLTAYNDDFSFVGTYTPETMATYYEFEVYQGNTSIRGDHIDALESGHTYYSYLPEGLEPGVYTLKVRACNSDYNPPLWSEYAYLDFTHT